MVIRISVKTAGQGLLDITDQIRSLVSKQNIVHGLCTLFIAHTSASLLIQENADASARQDLEIWLNRLVPENDSIYSHTAEGPDDMPAHIKSMLTQSSLSVPIDNGRLVLGIWQGIYVFEHRKGVHNRKVVIHLLSD